MTDPVSAVDLVLRSITEPSTSHVRNFGVKPTQRAQVGQNITAEDESPTVFFSQLTITVPGADDEEVAFEFSSSVRVEFGIRDEREIRPTDASDMEGAFDFVRRLVDPYHRKSLIDAMTRAGLPPLMLPLPEGDGWQSSD
jgi:preprotein translocase subunit SecB